MHYMYTTLHCRVQPTYCALKILMALFLRAGHKLLRYYKPHQKEIVCTIPPFEWFLCVVS